MAKILIINPFGIGDVLFSTPLISAIKKRSPGTNIGYICNIRTKEILDTNPEINEVFVFERDEYRALWKKSKAECVRKLLNFWGEIKDRRFDKVIDLSLGREYAFFSWLIGIKERKGFNYKGRGRFLTHRIPFDGFNDKPVAEYYLDIVGSRLAASLLARTVKSGNGYYSSEAEGRVENRKLKTVLITTDTDEAYIDDFLRKEGIKEEDLLVGIVPGGGASYGSEKAGYKRWGYERFALLSDKIASLGAKVVLFGGPTEGKLIKDVALKMQNRPVIAPEMKIREAACLIKRCKLIICNDGGILHMAVSQNVPTISIFGPTDEKVYGPYPASQKHIVIKSNIECRPCYKRFKLPECDTKGCLEGISVGEVFDVACSQLRSNNILRA